MLYACVCTYTSILYTHTVCYVPMMTPVTSEDTILPDIYIVYGYVCMYKHQVCKNSIYISKHTV